MGKIMPILLIALFALAAVGETHAAAKGWGRAYTTTQVIGMQVQNRSGEDLGKVSDLVFDADGRVAFYVVSHDQTMVAVPFGAVSFDPQKMSLALDMSKDAFASAPTFLVDHLTSGEWAEHAYRYFGQTPYWTTEAGSPGEAPAMKEQPKSEQPMKKTY
jgi:sporulation protein YlmC with PRC-barrel domain